MDKPVNSIIILILTSILAFTGLPFLFHQPLFFILFMLLAALASVTIFIFLMKKTASGATAYRTELPLILGFMGMILIGILGSVLIHQMRSIHLSQQLHQKWEISQHRENMESIRKNGLMTVLAQLLDRADQELATNAQSSLSEATIRRIARLSEAFEPRPFQYVEKADTLEDRISPERGLLLTTLVQMHLDSQTFSRIKAITTFAGADLKNADLENADLSGAILTCANLSGANLSGANLSYVVLKGANLWGAHLEKADLSYAELNRADLQWADLNETNLNWADLRNVDLCSAKLRKAILTNAIVSFANLKSAVCTEAQMECISLWGANLEYTILNQADLNQADLRLVNMDETSLLNSDLSHVLLQKSTVREKDWFAKLVEWQVIGANEIQEKYWIVEKDQNSKIFELLLRK